MTKSVRLTDQREGYTNPGWLADILAQNAGRYLAAAFTAAEIAARC